MIIWKSQGKYRIGLCQGYLEGCSSPAMISFCDSQIQCRYCFLTRTKLVEGDVDDTDERTSVFPGGVFCLLGKERMKA